MKKTDLKDQRLRAKSAAKSYLKGEYPGVRVAAKKHGIENPSVVQYWATKWSKNENIIAALRLCAEEASKDATHSLEATPTLAIASGASSLGSQQTGHTLSIDLQNSNPDSPAPIANLLDSFASTCVGVASGELGLEHSQVLHRSVDDDIHIPERVEDSDSDDDDVGPPHFSPSKSSEVIYKELYKWAAQAVKDDLLSSRRAQQLIHETRGIHIDHTTIHRASKGLIQSPMKAGRRSYIPMESEKKLHEFIVALRALKLPVFKATVCAYANKMIRNSEVAKKFKHGVVSDKWYYGFLKRWSLDTKNQRPFESDRVKWCTAKNLHQHYKVLAESLVGAGVAVWNPDFDEDERHSAMVKIIKPERLLSFDETRLTMDQTSTSKSKVERIVTIDEEDVGDVVANKGGGDGTLCASTLASGDAGPPLWIFAAESYKPAWTVDAPRSTVVDPVTGRGYPSTFFANKKGGMTFDLGVHFMKTNIAVMYPDLSPEKPVVVVCDGHGSHLTLELLDYCREVGINVVLR
ncbi:hypothetical protein CYMTET_34053 [Cymbomonas tetramitiformis]|uniref:HTH CENPB-type domain-containing protein n=1 Tax=Cymbomonas tetramitiformis TaxID=36881 RepID=A0AAE0KQ92_9CHLO|nr:hypothetical protein CYMTET_34053 [Cymbomonas tetramitiformis]